MRRRWRDGWARWSGWPAAIPRACAARTSPPRPPRGTPAARQVIAEVGWWIGFGLANLASVLDPECFVLGGGVVRAGDLLIESARTTFAELVEGGDRRPQAVIGPAAFGERAGAVGGALAARQGGLW